MTDLLITTRINQIIRAIDKMHGGLTTLIAANNKLDEQMMEAKRRIDALEAEIQALKNNPAE